MKEMFYLTKHSTHCILWLCGVRRIAKDHSDNEMKAKACTLLNNLSD